MSVYETNAFLSKQKDNTSLIEYACFYGSIQIVRYLIQNKVPLMGSLWRYAIHGNNPDVIHLIEENNVKPDFNSYEKCFKDSIKCYHNNIATYIKDSYLTNNSIDLLCKSLKYHNYEWIDSNSIDKSAFAYLCSFDYPYFVKILINDIDEKIINEPIFNNNFF